MATPNAIRAPHPVTWVQGLNGELLTHLAVMGLVFITALQFSFYFLTFLAVRDIKSVLVVTIFPKSKEFMEVNTLPKCWGAPNHFPLSSRAAGWGFSDPFFVWSWAES